MSIQTAQENRKRNGNREAGRAGIAHNPAGTRKPTGDQWVTLLVLPNMRTALSALPAVAFLSPSICCSQRHTILMTTPSEIETSSATAHRAPDNEVDVRRRSTSTPALREETPGLPYPGSVELQWFDRYSHLMVVLACMFVVVGISSLSINRFDAQPAMRVPLVVATIAAWFTLALLFQSSLQVCSSQRERLRLTRILMFPTVFLVLSGLAFVVAFLASPWTQQECGPGCRTAGKVVERVLVITTAAGGLGSVYFQQQVLTLVP